MLSLFVPLISTLEIFGPTFTQLSIKISWSLRGFLSFEFTENSDKILAYKPARYVGRVQLKFDGTRWCTGGEVNGKLSNGLGSQYSSHYLGT